MSATCEYTTETLIEHYNNQIATFGPTTNALQWYSKFTQEERYKIICNQINETNVSILDVGCGCGDLYDYIKTNKYPFNYTGIDISANMIISAQKAYPSGHFKCLNLNEICINNSFDYIVASGIFNLRMKNHLNTMITAINTMLNHTKKSVIVNFLSHKVTKWSKSNEFVYTNPHEILPYFTNSQNQIIDKYLPNDITLILSHKK
jgi:ubiquinone/menaquinone biosynthesis C-methylase UbiE